MTTYTLPPIGPVPITEEVKIPVVDLLSVNVSAMGVMPAGGEIDLSGFLGNLLGPLVVGKVLIYTFRIKGSWLVRIRDNFTGDLWFANVFVEDYSTKIDMKFSALSDNIVSTIGKLKTETERLRSVLRNEVKKNG
jgi:hypothetical protein